MTTKQIILKTLYRFIMFMSNLFPSKHAELINKSKVSPNSSVFNIPFLANNGSAITLGSYKGKKILIVNTASNCGYTGQYAELEKLYQQYKDKLVIIGFPANDFQHQEPGTDTEIAQFCKLNYGVSFPIMKKSRVKKGVEQNSLYQWLTDAAQNGWSSEEPSWNFCKYLIDEEGKLTHYFQQTVSPLEKKVISAIDGK